MTGTLAARLTLLQWLSPAFPTGAFAYSHGLEQAIAEGLRDPVAIRGWLEQVLLRGGGWLDAVLLARTLRGEDAAQMAALACALAGSAERLAETVEQGRALARTIAAIGGTPPPPQPSPPLPVALGVAARGLGLPVAEIVAHYLHGFAANLVLGAMRLVPLGQGQGQAMLAGLAPTILAAAQRACEGGPDLLDGCAIGADMAAMRHETLGTRIFRT